MIGIIAVALFAASIITGSVAHAATANLASDRTTVDPTNSGFSIVNCDGPAGAGHTIPSDLSSPMKPGYRVCDFNGAMQQIQHLIDIMMVLGVLVAVAMFTYAGYLYVSVAFSGKTGDIETAKGIFRKTFIGFAIMLCGWFIVFQILAWLTDNPSFSKLLGS